MCRAHLIGLSLVITLVILSIPARSVEGNEEVYHDKPERIKLELSSDKSRYLLGERIYIVLRVKNAGEKVVTVERSKYFSSPFSLSVTYPSGMVYQYSPRLSVHKAGNDYFSIQEDSEYSTAYLLDDAYKGSVTTEPGRYRLVASVEINAEGEKFVVTSNRLDIDVARPEGKDALAFQALKRIEISHELMWSTSTEMLEPYEDIIRKYDSTYSRHVRYCLSSIYYNKTVFSIKPDEAAKDMKKALSYANTLLPDTPFGFDTYDISIRCEAKLGNISAVSKLLKAATYAKKMTIENWYDCAVSHYFVENRMMTLGGKAVVTDKLSPSINLRSFCNSLGYDVTRTNEAVNIRNKSRSFVIDKNILTVEKDGKRYHVEIEEGREGDIWVNSVPVLTILREQSGELTAKAFENMVMRYRYER